MLLRDDPRAAAGRNGDTLLAHITPKEAAMLKRKGGAGTRNPRTGLLEFWDGDADGNGPGSGNAAGGAAGYGGGFGESSGAGSSNAAGGAGGYGGSWGGYNSPGNAGFGNASNNPELAKAPETYGQYGYSPGIGESISDFFSRNNPFPGMVNNPVATLANFGLSPLGLPYASQALNALAETVGKGIASLTGTDPNAIGPAGSEATAGGGGVDPSTGQPTGAPSPADGGFKPLTPQQLAAAAQPGANPTTPAAVRAADPQAQAARMAYGLLGWGKDAAMGPVAPAQRVGGGQQQRPTVYDFMPGARPRQGLLTG